MDTYRSRSTGNEEHDDTIENWLYIHHLPGVSGLAFRTLLEQLGSAEAILNADRKQLSALQIRPEVIQSLISRPLPDIRADLEWNRQQGHHIISFIDDAYPAALKELPDAPPVIYVRGDPDYLKQPQLAMVGSRNPTAAGRNTAREFASHLSNAGITITSGLASGIDGASHEGALQGLAGSIAVVAHGLDIVYPAHHHNLAQRISEHGAVVSEMPVGIQPQRGLFPRRNRLISALALGTLVVEAAQKSGSLITARYASEQNREVFAIPGSIHNPMARGCHQLIRQGAKLVETVDDILEELCAPLKNHTYYLQKPEKNIQQDLKDSHLALDPDHQKLLKCLAYEPASIDELVRTGDFTAAEVASMLLILELEGIISCQNGYYTRIR